MIPIVLVTEAQKTERTIQLLVYALVAIAAILGAITVWYWRHTDPRRQPVSGVRQAAVVGGRYQQAPPQMQPQMQMPAQGQYPGQAVGRQFHPQPGQQVYQPQPQMAQQPVQPAAYPQQGAVQPAQPRPAVTPSQMPATQQAGTPAVTPAVTPAKPGILSQPQQRR